jgi:predicted transcriptional regulator of viral defense system
MGNREYYLSYASALEIHDMTTQPQLKTFVSVQNMKRPLDASGYQYRFIFTKKEYFFGIGDYWATKQEKVKVSDPEKTIIDCLNHPRYCGGITEAAKALYMKRENLDRSKLIRYAGLMNKGSINGRLGYLMELYGMAGGNELKELKENLNTSYNIFDPMLPKEGKYLNDWMIFLNVSREELKNIGRT